MYQKPSLALLTFVLVSLLLPNTHALNNQKSLDDQQFDKLNSQQQSLEDQINTLLQDITKVQKNVSQTPNPSDKVLLLEKAVISERQKVFNMQNQLIPPFSFSKTACLQLTNQQKIDMLDKIKSTKVELANLQKQILTAPKCDKITGLEKDTQKQITLLQSLEKTIYTECQSKSILTPTIYQTNIYSDRWILGDQDIDDLIEEYYQRNIRYHNITNCPLDKPFFNGEQCIVCNDPEPVFNILTRQCTHCPEDQEPDSTLRQCAWKPHFTNFSSVDNWAQESAPMPVPSKQYVPCPPQKPYYNGKKCEVCLMPKYWSIKKNACVECPVATLFDVNDKKCEKPETNDLTVLQSTRWVTNDCNLTRVLDERVKVLNLNKTEKTYKMCPSEKPFYDGIVCLNCPNEFNIDTRKCVSSSNKSLGYDENMRCYVKKQSGFETDPRAGNYTSRVALSDSPTPNCKAATPYFDGVACIRCLEPFTIFDVDKRRCTACDPMEVYNNDKHRCLPRDKIYISTNDNYLMATPTKSIDDYHAEIAQKIKDNPDAVIYPCQSTEYSNFKACINCSEHQYFNVETKACQPCDGTLNTTTKVCLQKAYLYTNLNDQSIKRIVEVPTTIEKENKTINDNLNLHPNSKLCPLDKPYFDNKTCTNCTKQSYNMTARKCIPAQCSSPLLPYYNATSDSCQQCPKNQQYSNQSKTCLPLLYVTNTEAIFFYIEEGNYTKKSLEDKFFQLEKNNIVVACDPSHPYWNRTDCMDCAISRDATNVSELKPYFNLRTKQCVGCKNWDNVTKICNDTSNECFDPTPFFNPQTSKCEACPAGSNYSPATKKCETCLSYQIYNPATSKCETWVTNVTALNNNYIEQGNGTKSNLNATVEQIRAKENAAICPEDTPIFSRRDGKCIKCENPTGYWNILREMCMKCGKYNGESHQCEQELPRFDMNVQDFYGTIFGA